MVRASCFEVVSASVESRKLFLDGIMCLAQGVGPGVGVSSHLLEGSDLREFRNSVNVIQYVLHKQKARSCNVIGGSCV